MTKKSETNRLIKFANDPLSFFDSLTVPSAHGYVQFGEVMAEHQREWFEAIAPSLVSVANGEKPEIGRFWSERTKGASKDSDIACCILWLLAFSRQKLDMQVGAADKDQAMELKKAATDILRLNEWLYERVYDQSYTLRCDANDSVCTILSTDVAGSHGARPDIVVMNELSHVQKEEFAQNLVDNATKKPHGLVIVATNAGFLGTWQHTWREMARESERWDFHSFCEPAPWLSEAEVEEAERRNPTSRFHRLFWGEWISQLGDALDQEDIDACIDKTLTMMPREPNWFYVAGVDLGIKHDHSAVVVLAGRRDTQELRLAYAVSWAPSPQTGKVDLIDVESTLLALNQKYRFDIVGIDPYQAALLQQRLERQFVKCTEVPFSGGNLTTMASTLLEVFRSRRITLYPHTQLIKDLGRLSIVEKSYGFRLEATRDEQGHADLATAFAIALPLAVDNSRSKPLIGPLNLYGSNSNSYRSPFAQDVERFFKNVSDLEQHERKIASLPENDMQNVNVIVQPIHLSKRRN